MSEASERPTPPRLHLGDLLSEWERDAIRRHAGERGPRTGLPSVDKRLGDGFEQGIHIVHGVPGSGKTALMLQVAANCGCPCLLVTCEMSPLELLRRITARVTNTYLGRLKSGELVPEASLALARKAALECPDLAILDATRTAATYAHIRTAAELTRGDARHVLVIVDSVHSWSDARTNQATEYEALNAALADLRSLAHGLGCPVLGVAERNRDSMKSGGLSAGAGTRKIEYGAESVIDLHTDHEQFDGNGEKPVALKFTKNRNGDLGKAIDLRFHGALQRFREAF